MAPAPAAPRTLSVAPAPAGRSLVTWRNRAANLTPPPPPPPPGTDSDGAQPSESVPAPRGDCAVPRRESRRRTALDGLGVGGQCYTQSAISRRPGGAPARGPGRGSRRQLEPQTGRCPSRRAQSSLSLARRRHGRRRRRSPAAELARPARERGALQSFWRRLAAATTWRPGPQSLPAAAWAGQGPVAARGAPRALAAPRITTLPAGVGGRGWARPWRGRRRGTGRRGRAGPAGPGVCLRHGEKGRGSDTASPAGPARTKPVDTTPQTPGGTGIPASSIRDCRLEALT